MSEQIQLPAIPPASVPRDVAQALNPIGAFGEVATIALNEKLVPAHVCEAAIQSAESEIDGQIGPEKASEIGKQIVGQYPKRGKEDFHNGAVFARSLTALLAEYPETVVREVLKDLPRKHRWMPAIADVQDALDERVSARKLIIIGAKRQLKEHERRRSETDRDALVMQDKPQVQEGLKSLISDLTASMTPPKNVKEAAE